MGMNRMEPGLTAQTHLDRILNERQLDGRSLEEIADRLMDSALRVRLFVQNLRHFRALSEDIGTIDAARVDLEDALQVLEETTRDIAPDIDIKDFVLNRDRRT